MANETELNGTLIPETQTSTPEQAISSGQDTGASQATATPAAAETTPASTPSAAQTAAGVRDILRELGYATAAEQITDERELLRTLIEAGQRGEQVARDPYYQHYRQNADHYQRWLQEQQKVRAEPKRAPWQAPIGRDEYHGLVREFTTTDPTTGERRPKPNAPPDALQKIGQYEQHVRGWVDNLTYNPEAALEPLLKAAEERIQKSFEARLAAMGEQRQAEQIIAGNQDWMIEKDASGRPIVLANGQYRYTPKGMAYLQNVNHLDQLIKQPANASLHDQLAKKLARLEELEAKYGGQQNGKSKVDELIQNGNRRVPGAAVHTQPTTTSDHPVSLLDMMRQNMASYSDKDFESN